MIESTNIPLPWVDESLRRWLRVVDRLPHALLVTGGAGVGKSRFAYALACALLCERRAVGGLACGRCDACLWTSQGHHPDVRWLTPDDAEGEKDGGGTRETRAAPRTRREIKVDAVRSLADFVAVGAHRGGRRIVGIDPADALNAVAANALLKTLEEPTPGMVFLLVAERAELLPATIRSRTVAAPITPPSAGAVLQWLQATGGASADDARRWLAEAGGSPLGALAFAEPERAAAHRALVEAIARLPETPAMSIADVLAPLPPGAWLPVLHTWVVDLGRARAGAPVARHVAQRARLESLAARAPLGALVALARWLGEQRTLLEHPLNARLFCEDALLRYASLFEGPSR